MKNETYGCFITLATGVVFTTLHFLRNILAYHRMQELYAQHFIFFVTYELFQKVKVFVRIKYFPSRVRCNKTRAFSIMNKQKKL
jgi:hypothetical protein